MLWHFREIDLRWFLPKVALWNGPLILTHSFKNQSYSSLFIFINSRYISMKRPLLNTCCSRILMSFLCHSGLKDNQFSLTTVSWLVTWRTQYFYQYMMGDERLWVSILYVKKNCSLRKAISPCDKGCYWHLKRWKRTKGKYSRNKMRRIIVLVHCTSP